MRKCSLYLALTLSSPSAISEDLYDELVALGNEVQPSVIVQVCESERSWCDGYFLAVLHNLEIENGEDCGPHNRANAKYEDIVWAIIKSWLYRLPEEESVSLLNAARSALTEHGDCKKEN